MTVAGIDISNLQGPPADYRWQDWYREAAYVVCQAIPRGPGDVEDQLRAATADGKQVGIYTWLWHDGYWRLAWDVATDQMRRLATVPDDVRVNMRPWLDCEDNQSANWAGVSVDRRRTDVLEALGALKAWADGRGLPQPGVYSSRYFRDLLYGGSWDWLPEGTVLWLAGYGVAPGSLIGGLCVGHQYASEPVDLDLFLESEFVSENPTPPPDYATALASVTATDGEIVPVLRRIAATPRLLLRARAELGAVADRLLAVHDEFLGP